MKELLVLPVVRSDLRMRKASTLRRSDSTVQQWRASWETHVETLLQRIMQWLDASRNAGITDLSEAGGRSEIRPKDQSAGNFPAARSAKASGAPSMSDRLGVERMYHQKQRDTRFDSATMHNIHGSPSHPSRRMAGGIILRRNTAYS